MGDKNIQSCPYYQAQTGGNRILNSRVYKWNGVDDFNKVQDIETIGASDWTAFEMSGEHYLAVANAYGYDGSNPATHTGNVDSVVYKWNGAQFDEITAQRIPTKKARHWEFFEVSGERYLAMANNELDICCSAATHDGNINSTVYKWNGLRFDPFQSIPTKRAQWLESFEISGERYFAVANYKDTDIPSDGMTEFDIYSIIYKWDVSRFVEFQSIRTKGAKEWKAFEISGDQYLAVANAKGDSKVYKWDGARFDESTAQSIPTDGTGGTWSTNSLAFFEMSGYQYLGFSNFNMDSKLYRWNGAQFDEVYTIPALAPDSVTFGIRRWEPFEMSGVQYAVFANSKDRTTSPHNREIDSVVYRLSCVPPCSLGDSVPCPTGEMCAGNQCCADGSTCPSAQNSFTGCSSGKGYDCR